MIIITIPAIYNGWESYMANAEYNTWEDALNEYRTYTKQWNQSIEHSVN
jgi:hypothetical protein